MTKIYRGYDKNDGMKGRQDFVWFSFDKNIATGYSQYRDNGDVVEMELPRNLDIVNFGRSEYTTDIQGLVSILHRQTKKDKKIGLDLYRKIMAKYGKSKKTLHKWIFEDVEIRSLVLIYGFNAITMTEDGFQTIGILRSKL